MPLINVLSLILLLTVRWKTNMQFPHRADFDGDFGSRNVLRNGEGPAVYDLDSPPLVVCRSDLRELEGIRDGCVVRYDHVLFNIVRRWDSCKQNIGQ